VDSRIRIPPFPATLTHFYHLLILASYLILTLYHHHRVLLKYIGSLAFTVFPSPFSSVHYIVTGWCFNLSLWSSAPHPFPPPYV